MLKMAKDGVPIYSKEYWITKTEVDTTPDQELPPVETTDKTDDDGEKVVDEHEVI